MHVGKQAIMMMWELQQVKLHACLHAPYLTTQHPMKLALPNSLFLSFPPIFQPPPPPSLSPLSARQVDVPGLKEPKVLLNGISGLVRPGSMTALMGSSGRRAPHCTALRGADCLPAAGHLR